MRSTYTVVLNTYKKKPTEVEVTYNQDRENIEFQNGTYLKQEAVADLIVNFLQPELAKRDIKK